MKKKIIGLIPTRLNSSRLPQKPLLEIQGIPLVVHTYKRAKLSKKLDDVFICCDHKKIFDVAKKFGAKCLMTSVKHKNGTERIYEAYKKIKKKYNIILDIQGDEPLISPNHIDKVVDYHLKNLNVDIILPNLKIPNNNNTNIVKLVTDINDKVLYLSRSSIPLEFKSKIKHLKKHLSIISFKPEALKLFAKTPKTQLEKVEDIELLRALEIGLSIKTLNLKGDSYSVDVKTDFKKASIEMNKDKFYKFYKT